MSRSHLLFRSSYAQEEGVYRYQFFIHGSAMLCEKARELCFSSEITMAESSTVQKVVQRQSTEVRNSEQNTRHVSVARTATPNKRKRSQTPGDCVRVNKLGSMDTLPTKCQETAIPINPIHDRNKEIGTAHHMQSYKRPAGHLIS